MRLFLALQVPQAVRGTLDAAVAPLRSARDDLSWTRAENWHVTLAFLGEVALGPDPVVAAIEDEVVPVAPIDLQLDHAGHFGRRILWMGVADDPPGAITALGERLQEALAEHDLPVDRKPVRPHLTLARVRGRGRGAVTSHLVDEVPPTSGAWTASAVEVVASHLGAGGARYEVVASVPLSASRF